MPTQYLASFDNSVKSTQLFFKGHIALSFVLTVVGSGAKQRHVAIWPVDLLQMLLCLCHKPANAYLLLRDVLSTVTCSRSM